MIALQWYFQANCHEVTKQKLHTWYVIALCTRVRLSATGQNASVCRFRQGITSMHYAMPMFNWWQ